MTFLIEATAYKMDLIDVNATNNWIIMDKCTLQMDRVLLNNVIIESGMSSLHIIHSHFDKAGRLGLETNCNLTMTDTIVVHHGHSADRVPFLDTANYVWVKISNCTFSNIPALLNGQHSFISMDNCRIGDSQSINKTNVKQFIDISKGSHLIIRDTNITNNNPTEFKMFFQRHVKKSNENV